MRGDEFVYAETTGEWVSAAEAAANAKAAGQVEVRDSVGNLLADGDEQEIDCRHEAIKGLVLRAEFVRKV